KSIVWSVPGFEISAMTALSGMTFSPAEVGNRKVASRLLVEIEYLLVAPSTYAMHEQTVISVGGITDSEKK
ncbi:MAG TPA: hypothetical protein VGO72_03315, partial [Herminiimonas sp.]|nr:hypothetical protein [Herminiimonas sp.]